jgi:hypothetical protein
MQLEKMEHAVKAMNTALCRFGRKVKIVIIRLGAKGAAKCTHEPVEENDAFRIGCLLDKGVIIQSKDVCTLKIERASEDLAQEILKGQERRLGRVSGGQAAQLR